MVGAFAVHLAPVSATTPRQGEEHFLLLFPLAPSPPLTPRALFYYLPRSLNSIGDALGLTEAILFVEVSAQAGTFLQRHCFAVLFSIGLPPLNRNTPRPMLNLRWTGIDDLLLQTDTPSHAS